MIVFAYPASFIVKATASVTLIPTDFQRVMWFEISCEASSLRIERIAVNTRMYRTGMTRQMRRRHEACVTVSAVLGCLTCGVVRLSPYFYIFVTSIVAS